MEVLNNLFYTVQLCLKSVICVHILLILKVPISEKSIYEGQKMTDCMFNYVYKYHVSSVLKSLNSNLFYVPVFEDFIKNVWRYDEIACFFL